LDELLIKIEKKQSPMIINLIRGSQAASKKADVNIIIDVIRAFTVSHFAFSQGVKKIYLVKEAEEAFALKRKHPDYLLFGEIEGLPIAGFDGDNSPVNLEKMDLREKILVQRTTNGVKCVLNNLDAKYILVTGYSCATNTVCFVKNLIRDQCLGTINVIASNSKSDEDIACAEYIRDLILGAESVDVGLIKSRIVDSQAAKKFFDKNNNAFNEDDIHMCIKEIDTSIAMRVDTSSAYPAIVSIPCESIPAQGNFSDPNFPNILP
jgi:2-phosphosulfolactate phosphatase